MEGDTKICVDALNSDLSSIEWSISTLLCNVVGRGGALAWLGGGGDPQNFEKLFYIMYNNSKL